MKKLNNSRWTERAKRDGSRYPEQERGLIPHERAGFFRGARVVRKGFTRSSEITELSVLCRLQAKHDRKLEVGARA